MNERRFDNLIEKGKQISDYRRVNVDLAWDAFAKNINTESNQIKTRRLIPFKWMSIAASFLLLAFFILNQDANNSGFNVNKTSDLAQSFELPDGSTVVLEPNSKLFYPESFDELDDRKLFLAGNASFDVVSMKDKPFIVEYNDFYVKVLGTKFLIDNSKGNKTLISNIEGSVSVTDKEDELNTVILNAGDHIYFSRSTFESPKPVIAPVKKAISSKSLYLIYEHIYRVSDGRTFLHKDGKMMGKITLKVDLNQPVKDIIKSLDQQANILFEKGDCSDCYTIYQIAEKR